MNVRPASLALLVVGAITLAIVFSEPSGVTQLLVLGYFAASASYWALKEEVVRRQQRELAQVQEAFLKQEEQAKRIIRADLELHRTQEELDRKLASLLALHELGQQLRISLQPHEIYGKLTPDLITSFGFSKSLVGLCDASPHVTWHAMIGIHESSAEAIQRHLQTSGLLRDLLEHPAPRRLDAQRVADDPAAAKLLELASANSLTLAVIKPTAGPPGCLLLAREGLGASAWKGEEELLEVLVNQLATAIEGSALYEELWRSRQSLERTVQERTRELADANVRLIRLDKAKSDFVSAVSHELRTPLSAVKGYASLLRGGQFGPLQPAQLERLAKIEKHADLLADFINNLLDIARIESGRVTMTRRALDTSELFASVLDVLKPQADAKRISVSFDADGVTRVVGDPSHLPRVLINLLSNAVKYTPEGGTITVSVARQGDEIVTAVRDNGSGIDPAELPKLFQEFYRASNPLNEQIRGTGLGLTLVKRIVEAHHGRIWVDSKVGQGSTFTFTLPAEATPDATA